MTTTVIYASTADAFISSTNATYATAAAGSSLSVTSNSELKVGQTTAYLIQQIFLDFDTSAIGDTDVVSQVDLALYGKQNTSTTDFTLTALSFDWSSGGVTTADWRTPAQLLALTTLATLSTSGFTTSGYNTLTSAGAAFNSWVNLTGTSYLMVASSQNISSTAPTNDSYVVCHSTAVVGTTQDPKITVTHEAPGPISGTTDLTFTTAGALTGSGELAGAISSTFTTAGDLTGGGALEGASDFAFTASGDLLGDGALEGAIPFAFDVTGDLTSDMPIEGSTSFAFTTEGALDGIGDLAGETTLTFTLTGALRNANVNTGTFSRFIQPFAA